MSLDINPIKPQAIPLTGAAGPVAAENTGAVNAAQPDAIPAVGGPTSTIVADNAVIGSGDVSAMGLNSRTSSVELGGMEDCEVGLIDRHKVPDVRPTLPVTEVPEIPEVPEPISEPEAPPVDIPPIPETVIPDPVQPVPQPEEPVITPPPVVNPPEVVHPTPPPPPPTEKVITVGGTGMGADKTYKMYPSELAAVYAIIREKGVVSLEQMAADLKTHYGIDATVQNGVIVNSSNGHTLIADGNGNGALDMGDIDFNTALQSAGIDPADIGKPGERLLPLSPAETLGGLGFYANEYAKKIYEALAHTGTAAEAPNPPDLPPKAAINDLVKQLKELMAKEHELLQEAQALEMNGVPADVVAQSNSRFNEITKEIADMRQNQILPIAQQLGDYIKAAKSYLGETPDAVTGAAPAAQQEIHDEYAAALTQVLGDMKTKEAALSQVIGTRSETPDSKQELEDLRAQIADTEQQLDHYKSSKTDNPIVRDGNLGIQLEAELV